MEQRGITKKEFFRLTPPGETDTLGDLDRLRQAMESVLGPVRIPYRAARRDARVLAASGYAVTATVWWDGAGWNLLRIEEGDRRLRHYGLAADLGSTTVTVSLLDCNTGAHLGSQTGANRQIAYGEDILSRIFYTKDDEEKRNELQEQTARTLNELTEALLYEAGVEPGEIGAMTIGGNTTMLQFLWGLDAFRIFSAPFAPVAGAMEPIPAGELGLALDAMVYCYPAAANYLGGDVTAGILATGMTRREGVSLLIDIGTNGEITLGNRDFLIAGAGAAGPALEGGISRHGMRAEPGAIDTVTIDETGLHTTVLGGGKARGICGSGVVDLLAQMLLSGWMLCSGRLAEGKDPRIVPYEGELAVQYATGEESETGEPLYFTQEDIRQFTQTKAAANTMVGCLLEASGLTAAEVETIYLAGAFGQHLNLESAIAIGMYPDLPREKFVVAGNTSLAGAEALLLDRENWQRAQEVVKTIYYLQFAMQEDFLPRMQAARFYPHTDLSLYPTVAKALSRLAEGKLDTAAEHGTINKD